VAAQKALDHAMHMATLKLNRDDLDFRLMNSREVSRYIEEQGRKLKDV